jgi:Uma2 family endonuclease
MATVETTRLTVEEFWEWSIRPENQDRRCELENGEIIDMPSPGELHGIVCFLVAHLLGAHLFRIGRGHICINDTGLVVARDPATVRGPDVMVFLEPFSLDRASRRWVERLPQLVVEVLSPSDQAGRVNRRVVQYLNRGVPLIWLVDPELRTVTTYRPGQQMQVLDETDELSGSDALPEFRCRVAELFALPGGPAPEGAA